jgi:protein TonB
MADLTVLARPRPNHSLSPRSGLSPAALATTLALHAAIIAALCLLAIPRRLPPPPAAAVAVVFTPTAPANPEPELLASTTLPAQVSEEPAILSPVLPLILPAGPQGEIPRTTPHHPNTARTTVVKAPRGAAVPSTRQPVAAPMQASTASSPPSGVLPSGAPPSGAPPSAGTLHDLAAWEARIRQAVQDAAVYPAAARLLHREGRAQVQFRYDQGEVDLVGIAHSSEVDALDHAAVSAVTRAAIPSPPAALGPQKRTMLVWVQFRLVSED